MISSNNTEGPLRVLVVDDSAFNRRNIGDILSSSPDVLVVGKASDGEEALRLVSTLRPDMITLDLEMPRMDGFTFLRILMSKMPTPVIVVSSYSQKENVFKALELGALDFVAKPERAADAELETIRDELVKKVFLARTLRSTNFYTAPRRRLESLIDLRELRRSTPPAPTSPRYLIGIASSTGGPTALMEVFSRLPGDSRDAYLIAQHMPDKFTRTFAERLDRRSPVSVAEAQDMDAINPGGALVCPGRRCMEVMRTSLGELRVRIAQPSEEDRYVPSADRLLASVARVAGNRAIGVILTGMGDDGVRGAKDIGKAGGSVIAESEATAVVYGMPGAAVRAGVVTRTLPLGDIGDFLARLPDPVA
jgi:two-component system chemotaxis response regulator CheB